MMKTTVVSSSRWLEARKFVLLVVPITYQSKYLLNPNRERNGSIFVRPYRGVGTILTLHIRRRADPRR